MNMIETHGLTKYYGAKAAVDGLSLTVEQNTIFGFLGCNGAGKTTTLAMLAGLVKKTSGTILIDGKDLTRQEDEIKKVMGVMVQNTDIYPYKTSFNNLLYFALLKGMEKKNAKDEINSLFKDLQCEELKKIKAGKLSHGQQKLLLIMQAFLNSPKLVLLDESITGFDPKKIVMLREFFKRRGKATTIVISSHDLDEVDRLCTHIGIIHEGKLIVQGKKDKIKKGKSLEKVFIENI